MNVQTAIFVAESLIQRFAELIDAPPEDKEEPGPFFLRWADECLTCLHVFNCRWQEMRDEVSTEERCRLHDQFTKLAERMMLRTRTLYNEARHSPHNCPALDGGDKLVETEGQA